MIFICINSLFGLKYFASLPLLETHALRKCFGDGRGTKNQGQRHITGI